ARMLYLSHVLGTAGNESGGPRDGRSLRHRAVGRDRPRRSSLDRGHGRPPSGGPRGGRQKGWLALHPGAMRRIGRSLGGGTLRPHRERARPARSSLQQRGYGLAPGAARGYSARLVAVGDRHQPHRVIPLYPGRFPTDEEANAEGRTHHQQWLDLGDGTASAYDRLYGLETRRHGPDQGYLSGRPALRHRLRSDRYRQHRDGADVADESGHLAGRRLNAAGAAVRCQVRGRCGPVHGRSAAHSERVVHDRDGDEDALRRTRLRLAQPLIEEPAPPIEAEAAGDGAQDHGGAEPDTVSDGPGDRTCGESTGTGEDSAHAT